MIHPDTQAALDAAHAALDAVRHQTRQIAEPYDDSALVAGLAKITTAIGALSIPVAEKEPRRSR